MANKMPPGQQLSFVAGILVVYMIDFFTESVHLAGPGLEGALRAGFWYGIVGCGGGLVVYEIIRRIKGGNR